MYKQLLRSFINLPLKHCISTNTIFTKVNCNSFVLLDTPFSCKILLCDLTRQIVKRNYSGENKNVNEKNEEYIDDGIKNSTSAENEKEMKLLDIKGQEVLDQFLTNAENEKFYKTLMLEIEIWRQENERVPDCILPRHWAHLITLKSQSQRKRYVSFLYSVEKKIQARKRKQEEKRIEREKHLKEKNLKSATTDANEIRYELSGNSLFLRIYEKTMNQMWNRRLINAMLFGNKVVMDCDYESYMNNLEVTSCARQILHGFAANRIHDMPFDIYFCNVNKSGTLMQKLHNFIPRMYDTDYPMRIHEQSYLDIFDKKQLLYLTPHCREELTEYDPNTIYIIGAYVDKCQGKPLSLAKAKREGLRIGKLPLDTYLEWGSGSSKNLTLNQVLGMLLDVQRYHSWKVAMQNVPVRKLLVNRRQKLEKKIQKEIQYNEKYSVNLNTETLDDNSFTRNIALPQSKVQHSFQNSFNISNEFNQTSDFSHESRARMRKNWNK